MLSKMSSFQLKKNYKTRRRKGKYNSYTGDGVWWGRQAIETGWESDLMSDLTDKEFKVAIIIFFKEVKKTMIKEVRKV